MSIYLKIPEVPGDTIVEGHEEEMQLISFYNGVAHSANPAEASSQVTGLVTAAPITVTKYVDKSTPLVIQACCDGKVFDDDIVVTHTKKVAEQTVDYLTITLKEAQIINDSITSGGDEAPLETISIAYGEINWEYIPFKKGGEQEGAVEATYNVQTQQNA